MTGSRIREADGPEFLEGRYYHDPAVHELETRTVFPSSWIFVCDDQELSEPGDFVTTVIGSEPVVVLRNVDGQISSYINVCPHRGSTLLRGLGNCAGIISCPYHGWRFGMDGIFKSARFGSRMSTAPGPAFPDLLPVRVDRWRRFVFVTLSQDAPSLAEWLEDACGMTAAYPLEAATRTARRYDRQPINWKVFWDINLDVYHIPTVHSKSVADEFRILDTTLWAGRKNTSYAQFIPKSPMVPADQVLPGISEPQRHGTFRVAVYPNFVASFEPDGHFFISWVLPTAVDECVIGAIAYGLPGRDTVLSSAELQDGMDLMLKVQEEDYAACRRISTGLRSSAYRPGPAHSLELQTEQLHRWLRDAYTWTDTTGSGWSER